MKKLVEMIKNAKLEKKIRVVGDVLIIVEAVQISAEFYRKHIKSQFTNKENVTQTANEAS